MPRFRPRLFLIDAAGVPGRVPAAVAWALVSFAPESVLVLGEPSDGLPEWLFRPHSSPSDANGILVGGTYVLSADEAFRQLPLLDGRSVVFGGIGEVGMDAAAVRSIYGRGATPRAVAILAAIREGDGFPGIPAPFRTVAALAENAGRMDRGLRGVEALRRFMSRPAFRSRLASVALRLGGRPDLLPPVDPVFFGRILLDAGEGDYAKALVEAYWNC